MQRGCDGRALRLGLIFATAYFIQGIGEPNEGLIAQPVRSLLKSWGHSATDASFFWAVLSVPWTIKPIYGMLSDFLPIFGSRRRSYLILTTGATVVGFIGLFLLPPESGQIGRLTLGLLAATIGVAFADVVIDALMVEQGQPLGMTGRLQSIQWASMYGASIGTGFVGGWLSQHGHPEWGFLICGVATSVTLLMAILLVKEPAEASPVAPLVVLRLLWQAVRTPGVLLASAFLFLWNFNPFSSTVLYLYSADELGFSEQFQGNLTSLYAAAAVVASLTYSFLCRRVSFAALVHVAIAAGVVATLAYWLMSDQTSAVIVTSIVGFTYMTGSLIQLDLTARLCPPRVAGTIFALLMSLSNGSIMLSAALGGPLYDGLSARWGARFAFHSLVALGAACTAACWLMTAFFRRVDWNRGSSIDHERDR